MEIEIENKIKKNNPQPNKKKKEKKKLVTNENKSPKDPKCSKVFELTIY